MTMTAAQVTTEIPAVPAGPPPTRPRATPPPQHRSGWPQAVALSMTIILAALVGFAVFVFGLSALAETRHQNTLYKTFSYQLGQALAPVGPAPQGAPVALLNVPRLGLHNVVVVEGTTSRDLTAGPGHNPSTPLPGQAGTSVIMGKRTTYGAPFSGLLSLRIGDPITVTTGLGIATYTVSSFGTTGKPAPINSADRLVLVTANGYLHPTGYVTVSADLKGRPQASSGALPSMSAAMAPMVGDPGESLIPLLLWSQVLLVVAAGGTFAIQRWSRWPAIFCLVPILLAVTWNVSENISGLLPNLF